MVRHPRTALFPPHNDEIVFQARGVLLRQEIIRHTAVQVEQRRFGAVFSTNEHALLHAININPDFFGNAARQRLSVFVQKGRWGTGAPCPQHAQQQKQAASEYGKCDQR